ncbi:MAG TPA: biotin carboxylase N-terminal domain-containing protein [Verrucomicrobiae bacterium]|nr:biotin carboxylase N-terminal domain-containing protein [Verrucomicrobiae bacterium]
MIRKVLIACGGEVAVQLFREFARSNVQTVAVYTQEDCNSKHVQFADIGICIGETLKSYESDWRRIISAAKITDADAIHPGNGPLSAHGRFAQVCTERGIHLIGGDAQPGSPGNGRPQPD